MRILLLPVTQARTIIFCQRQAAPAVRAKPRFDERIANKGEKFWTNFENSDKKWKLTVVKYVGKLLDTVPFEEGCIRTIPPKNTWKRQLEGSQEMISEKQAAKKQLEDKLKPVKLLYPTTVHQTRDFNAALSLISRAIADALKTHRKQMWWCALGLPLTVPFALNPFIPNFPGFFLIYRMWCNWKAIKAAQHLKYLSQHHQLTSMQDAALDEAYQTYFHGHMDSKLEHQLHGIFLDPMLNRELHQAVRQTSKDADKTKKEQAAIS